MVWRRIGAVCCFVLIFSNAFAADVQVVWGTAFDSNLYEVATGAQSGLVSRFFMTADTYPFRGKQSAIKLQQQAGVKRFWSKGNGYAEPGDVFVYQLDLQGQRRLGARASLVTSGHVKFKQATRAPGEESYLRGGFVANLQVKLAPMWVVGGMVRGGADDSRDVILPEVHYRQVDGELRFVRSRRLTGRLSYSLQWLSYNRPALIRDARSNRVAFGVDAQDDRLQILGLDIQAYHGMFLQGAYAFLHNTSNSFGYGYHAHRFQGMVIRHLGWGVDAQVFGQFQLRQYSDLLPDLSGRASEADEYEQTMGIVKFSRELSARYGVSAQYAFYRNGARQSAAFYRKHVFGLSFDAKL